MAKGNMSVFDHKCRKCGCQFSSRDRIPVCSECFTDSDLIPGLEEEEALAASKWEDNSIQFPRLIEEAQAAGAFTKEVINDMAESMDLQTHEVHELLERARVKWEKIKESL